MVGNLVSRRKGDWERLEALIERCRTSEIGALSAEEIVELGFLYRRAVADLAIARRDFPRDRVCLYLNQLVGRAHGVVYRSEAGNWEAMVRFFRQGFPSLFRETLPFTGAAFAIFAFAAIVAFFAVLFVPDSASYLVPPQVAASVKEQRMWTEEMILPSQLMAGLIMTNNIKVALLSFAGGVLVGVFTFYIMALNGLTVGAIAGICQAYGLSLRLWSFIAPHGVIELTVIFISGGSGFRLGYAILHPGLHSRREALSIAAHQVVRLLFGCLPLLVIAGTIEGFISPSMLAPAAKLAVGAATALLLYSYLFFCGRKPAGASIKNNAVNDN